MARERHEYDHFENPEENNSAQSFHNIGTLLGTYISTSLKTKVETKAKTCSVSSGGRRLRVFLNPL